MPLQPDTIIHNQYRIHRLIGRGGMAQVWLAEDIRLGRKVAIKSPKPGLGSTDASEITRRFQREVAVSGALADANTPNIVQALTALEYEGGLLLVMEYMPGRDLRNRIKQNPQGMPIAEIIRIAEDIMVALAGVHEHPLDIIHRDIKPSNILFDARGRARLADFGLAQVADWSDDRTQLLGRQQPGTVMYMAPEQEMGIGRLSPAADVFALGAVIFEMLTGKKYKTVTPGTRPSQLRSGIPAWLDEFVVRATAERVQDRWQTGGQMLEAWGKSRRLSGTSKKKPQKQSKPNNIQSSHRKEQDDGFEVWELLSESISVLIALAAFLDPGLFPRSGTADLIIELIGFVAAIIAVIIPGRRLQRGLRNKQSGDEIRARQDFGIFAMVVVVALVVILFGFYGYLAFLNNNPPGSQPSQAESTAVTQLPSSPATSTKSLPTATKSAQELPMPTPPTPAPTSSPPTATPAPTSIPTVSVSETQDISHLFVEYLIDASSGMMQPWTQNTEPKLASIQRVLPVLWQNDAAAMNIGLRAYGHRRPSTDPQTCDDVELLRAVRQWDANDLITSLFNIRAQGLDSSTTALREAYGDFQYKSGRLNALIFLAEGGDTCGGDPLSIIEAQKEIGVVLPVFVVALEPETPSRAVLQNLATQSGGQFFEVHNPSQLYETLHAISEALIKAAP